MSADKAFMFLNAWRIGYPDAPEPTAEYRFHPTRKWRFDWAWPMHPGHPVAVEVDGNAWGVAGGGRHATDADRDKLNHAAALGWIVFRFSPQQLVNDPWQCIALVAQALGCEVSS